MKSDFKTLYLKRDKKVIYYIVNEKNDCISGHMRFDEVREAIIWARAYMTSWSNDYKIDTNKYL